ncbi:hypothetical protein [Peptostreptococcus faecalis]|uniref:hypothetical protein n=1 Tax=Peptostreptococcus faecalis TaxID=2045015 RepID=UPI000C7CF722|nr:hypothetical protein [Peptostreptococcus faecalis]
METNKIKYTLKKYLLIVRNFYNKKREKDKKYENLRINSIDVLRGIAVIMALFLINQGLEDSINTNHVVSTWNGMNFADVILPIFILVMGMSIPFYVKKNYENGDKVLEIVKKIMIRSILIFIIGLVYSALFVDARGIVRLTGGYQLIAVVYVICALLYISFLKIRIKNNALTYVFLVFGTIISIIFTAIAFGGKGIESNAFVVFDNMVIGDFLSASKADPEGILATLSSLSLGMYGLSLGCIINKKKIENKKYINYIRISKIKQNGFSKENLIHDIKSWINIRSIKAILSNYYRLNDELKKIVNMFLLGILLHVLSLIIGIWIPLNRNVFSITFVLRISSYVYFIMTVLYVVCDIVNIKHVVKFIQRIGENAILIIFTVSLVHKLIGLIKIKSIYTGTWLNFNNWFTTDFILPVTGIDTASAFYAAVITIIWIIIFNILEKYDIKINI